MSLYFNVYYGVKQGGVISPILFEVYRDKLMLRLKATGVRCHIGKCFLAALGYLNNMTLLSPIKWLIYFPKNSTLTSILKNATWLLWNKFV